MSAKKKKGKSETRPELTEEISESTFERVPVPLLEEFFALSRPGLTGVPRQRKDKPAEVANAVAAWRLAHTDGIKCVSDVANQKLDFIYANDDLASVELPDSLVLAVDRVSKVVLRMEDAVEKLGQLAVEFRALGMVNDSNCEVSSPLTVEIETSLSDLVDSIYKDFEKETRLKEAIKSRIAHVTTRHQTMFYTAAWTHLPYVDETAIEFHLSSILKATGHG